MSSSGDDARKKRDCNQVVLQEQEHQPKKQVRVHDGKSPPSSSSSSSSASSKARTTLSPPRRVLVRDANNHASIPQTSTTDPHVVWDLEGALQYLVSVETKYSEFLNDTTTVSFRVGHAGDASTIANLYQQSQAPKSPEFELRKTTTSTTTTITTTTTTEPEEESSSLLELWLAEGMGDEDTPPSFHVLLAHIQNGSGSGGGVSGPSQLAAVALLTISWEEDTRMLRVEWLYLDPSLDRPVGLALEGRLWLRLSSCALLTACQLVQVEEDLTSVGDGKTVTEASRLPPSAE